MRMADDWLGREQAGFAPMNEQAFFERLRAHVIADIASERPFSLFNPNGEWTAGNRLDLPASTVVNAPLDRPFDSTMNRDGWKPHYRGVIHRTPRGDLLLIAENTGDAAHFDEILIHALLLGGAFTGVLGLAGAAIAGADAVRRIDAVTRATERIVSGDLSQRRRAPGWVISIG